MNMYALTHFMIGRPGSHEARGMAGVRPAVTLRPAVGYAARAQHPLAHPPATLRPLLFAQQLGGSAAQYAAFLSAEARSAHAWRQRCIGLGSSGAPTEQLPAEDLSPLQRCLRAHGILDVSHWGQPRFAKYASEEYVRSNVEPKLAALEAHGLTPHQLERLLRPRTPHLLFPCALDTLTTNLKDLEEVMRGYQPDRTLRSRSKADLRGLSTVGQIIARKPHNMLAYLTTSPGSLISMRQWFEDELQVTGNQFSRLVWKHTELIIRRMGARNLELLQYLDGLKGEPGWGRALLLQNAVVARARQELVRGNVEVLEGFGLSRQAIVETFNTYPSILTFDLAGPLYQQKFAWIREEAPWGLSTFLESPGYLAANLKKMASRLDFIKQHGLAVPDAPNVVSNKHVDDFCEVVGRGIGREVSVAEFEAWVEGEWLPSAQGQRWGKPPGKQKK